MKNIIKLLALAAGVAGMSSCSDFLEQTAPSELNAFSEDLFQQGISVSRQILAGIANRQVS